MSNVTFHGRIISVSDPIVFNKNNTDYTYRTILFLLSDNNEEPLLIGKNRLAVTDWYDLELPQVGSVCKFTVKISSENNRKSPELFFHKINLQSIREI